MVGCPRRPGAGALVETSVPKTHHLSDHILERNFLIFNGFWSVVDGFWMCFNGFLYKLSDRFWKEFRSIIVFVYQATGPGRDRSPLRSMEAIRQANIPFPIILL